MQYNERCTKSPVQKLLCLFGALTLAIVARCLRVHVACLIYLDFTYTACSGATSRAAVTTSTKPPPPPLPTLPSPPVELATPPAACADADSPVSPLGRLRVAMRDSAYTQQQSVGFAAFIVFYTDEHLSEEPPVSERRLQYMSGWGGSGTGAVLADGGAAVWVAPGDVSRARAAVSCAWLVIDVEDTRQPTITEWIAENLKSPDRSLSGSIRVGADARLASVPEWYNLSSELQHQGLQLVHSATLVDQLWRSDVNSPRPESSRVVANLHKADYIGMSWKDKVAMLRKELRSSGADAMVVTALDEVAWLLNLRGKDVPHAPLMKAFVVVSARDVKIYAPAGKLTMPVQENLAVNNGGCFSANCSRVYEYTNIYTDLRRPNEWSKILVPSDATFQRGASAGINQAVPPAKKVGLLSPIISLKAQKNPAEVRGMRRAHLRDAVAMCTLLSYLEGIVKTTGLDELAVASKVDRTRMAQAGYVGLSMRTRAAFGPSGSDPDYIATNSTSRRVYTNSTLVIQSGGQYDEGTTVVTRTLYYGHPTRSERLAYTTTLRALAAMATLQTPPGTLPAAHVDLVARAPLWAAQQDYPHPTGHGVGAALNRREDPVVIDYRQDVNLFTFREGYFITSEPAWYEPGKFGVRLGNILEVVAKPGGYLGFVEATTLPFEPKLIDRSMLTSYEMKWLNDYNERIRKVVGPELKSQGLMDVYYWMMNKTVPVTAPVKMMKTCAAPELPTLGAALMVVTAAMMLF